MLRDSVIRASLGTACVVTSLLAHGWLVGPATRPTLSIAPERPTCHAGQAIRMVAFVQRGRVRTRAPGPVEWRSSDPKLLAIDRTGLAACRAAGHVTLTAYSSREGADVHVQVHPAIFEAALAPLKTVPEPPPPAPPAPTQPKAAPKRVRPAHAPPEPEPVVVEQPEEPAAPAPEAAAASAVLVTHAPATTDRAVTAPASSGAGHGIVAAGGTAAHGASGARAGGKLAGAGTAVQPRGGARDRSRAPRLLARDPCGGYFPEDAAVDRATVDMDVAVAPNGRVDRVKVLGEVPRGEGFGLAATRCFQRLRLDPALDRAGAPMAATLRLRFTFER